MFTTRARQTQSVLAGFVTCTAIASAAFLVPRSGDQVTAIAITPVNREAGKVIPGVIRVRRPDST
jgi:hypothetical protein